MERRLFLDAPCEGRQDDFVFYERTWTYPTQAQRLQQCLTACRGCPYLVECANFAVLVDKPLPGAVLGAMTPGQIARKRADPWLVEARRFLNRPKCGTNAAYNTHLHFGEDCDPCRDAHARRTNPVAA